MNKYTIYKAFEKKFPLSIWKIVVDAKAQMIAVELRDTDTTSPTFYVFDFSGNGLVENLKVEEKEWTLEALQHNTLILKRVGDNVPLREGILLLNFEGAVRYLSHEYIWVDTFLDFIKVRPRTIQYGFEEYINIFHAKKMIEKSNIVEEYCRSIKMPIPYTGDLPSHLKNVTIVDTAWVSRSENKLIWSYHTKDNSNYRLNLCVTDASNLLYENTLLNDMPKMIPQPYFQIENQIFLMSYNKQEIVSYLV
ncbi:hypothetical protein [Sphingobacterium sp. LRF_L2]|uniref:hypothetical protein n=1 Tax=Sphingobacterium sp. LRF_L2 TaxID=3369421 RepID=UPI003F6235E9